MSQLNFDTEGFIMAIKERPSIWDLSSEEYSNRDIKKAAWEEVTLMFGGSECTTPKEKGDLCSTLQKKWRSLKDCYGREKRRISGAKSGSGADRKTPYVYYNLLSFLNKGTPPVSTQSSIDRQDPEEPTENIDSPVGPYQSNSRPAIAKKRKPQDEVGKQLINVLKNSSEERKKFEKEVLEDEDKLFMMSIVNDFKKIPQEMKLSAKRQILTVIEQHQHGFPYNHGPQAHSYPLGFGTGIRENPQLHVMTGNSGARFEQHPFSSGTGNPNPAAYQQSTSGIGNSQNMARLRSSTPASPGVSVEELTEDSCSPLLLCFQDNIK